MADLSLLGGILGSVGNVVSTLITNHQNERLMDERNQQAIDQWQRENEYNTPLAMVNRLKAAGLSPALMYGNGNAAAPAASSPEFGASKQQAPQIDPLTMAQIANINADTKKKEAETEGTGFDNRIKEFNNSIIHANEPQIRGMANMAIRAGIAENEQQFYEASFAALYLSAIADYGTDYGDQSISGLVISKELHDLFKSVGVGEYQQSQLEQALYRSYVKAQEKVNEKAGEQAELEALMPEIINNIDNRTWRAVVTLAYLMFSKPNISLSLGFHGTNMKPSSRTSSKGNK